MTGLLPGVVIHFAKDVKSVNMFARLCVCLCVAGMVYADIIIALR